MFYFEWRKFVVWSCKKIGMAHTQEIQHTAVGALEPFISLNPIKVITKASGLERYIIRIVHFIVFINIVEWHDRISQNVIFFYRIAFNHQNIQNKTTMRWIRFSSSFYFDGSSLLPVDYLYLFPLALLFVQFYSIHVSHSICCNSSFFSVHQLHSIFFWNQWKGLTLCCTLIEFGFGNSLCISGLFSILWQLRKLMFSFSWLIIT